jgi:ribosome-associated protein
LSDDDIEVPGPHGVRIPATELTFRASRSGGAGGQHVNTSSTRIELLWNVETSAVLDDAQRDRLRDRLASRLDGEGSIRVVASRERSQLQNRREAIARLRDILARALQPPRIRRKTRPPRAAKEKRLQQKKQRSDIKKQRRMKE